MKTEYYPEDRMRAFLLAVAIYVAAISGSPAAVISHDWKTPGDGLLTYDTVNKREWLDLSQTLLQQFPGTAIEERYQSVVGELTAGKQFEGFMVAKRVDFFALAQSAAIDITTNDFNTNSGPVTRLIQLFGSTHVIPAIGFENSIGLLNELDGRPFFQRFAGILYYYPPGQFSSGDAQVFTTSGYDLVASSTTGVFLFRDVVPEPLGSSLIICGLTPLILTRLCRSSPIQIVSLHSIFSVLS
jgi:predicted Zn-dependent protease with MMP-like domain